ncbi:hypothetical protein MTO96_040737 [Rhipicephalus appendiculatus]
MRARDRSTPSAGSKSGPRSGPGRARLLPELVCAAFPRGATATVPCPPPRYGGFEALLLDGDGISGDARAFNLSSSESEHVAALRRCHCGI